MKFDKRRTLLIGAGLLLTFVAVEIQCYAFARLSIANGNSFMFYRTDVFDITNEQAAAENTAGPLGWPQTTVPRAQSPVQSSTCGSAFGDSMTHSDEVEDNEAWAHLLSGLLGCNVQNFGVGGYGLDQAALRYEQIAPPGKFVIVGIFVEMLRRDVAASWTFYRGPVRDGLPQYAITKPMFVMPEGQLQLVARPSAPVTRDAIVRHHKQDFYLNTLWTPLSFPYSYAAAHAIAHTLRYKSATEYSAFFWRRDHPSHAATLALKLLARLREQTKQRNQQLVLVMIPTVEYTLQPTLVYGSFLEDLARQEPGLCVIDLQQPLGAEASKIGIPALRAPQGHYSPAGNRIFAQAIRQGMGQCGISAM